MTDGETMETGGDCSSGSSLLLEDSVILSLGSEQGQEVEIEESEDEATNTDNKEETICTNKHQPGLTCLYTNADSLLGKRDLLKHRINELKPDIIAITESLPKNMSCSSLNTQVEYNIPGYNLLQGQHNKRGVVIYTANHIQASREDDLSDITHEEQIWCKIKTINGKNILFGNVYHSPNSTRVNHSKLREMILDCSKQGVEDIVIVGDFNMPDIDWESWNGRSEADVLFIETLQDHFMHQHVDEPTIFRFGQKPSLLDLVISSKEELVSDITWQKRPPMSQLQHKHRTGNHQ
jgi:hypothetical protein